MIPDVVVPDAVVGITMNKVELANHLDVTLKTLNNWIAKATDFPMISDGQQGTSYVFDPDAVTAWVETKKRREREDKAKEMTPNMRKVLAQAELIEIEIAEKRNEVVPIAEVEDLLADMMLTLAHSFETVMPRLKHEIGLDHSACIAVGAWLDGFRLDLSRKLKELTANEP